MALLEHLRGFLVPGGRLLLVTACQGGSAMIEVLNLWAASTENYGHLPDVDEMQEQMREAGFRHVSARRSMPGESMFQFVGTAP